MLFSILSVTFLTFAQGTDLRRVCYYTNWAQYRPEPQTYFPEDIDAELCTHYVFSCAIIEGNRLIPWEYNDIEMYGRLNNHVKTNNPSAKTLLGASSWTFDVISTMLSTSENRAEFISTSIIYLRQHGFNGIDLDFECYSCCGSSPEDKYRFTLLCEEARIAFNQEGIDTGRETLLLTATVSAVKSTIDAGYDISNIAQELDFINLKAYDLNGAWNNYTSHNSPLYPRSEETGLNATLNQNWAAEYWVSGGCPREKLNIGMALYGRCFNLTDTSQTGYWAPADGHCKPGIYTRNGGFMAYFEVCPFIEAGTATRVWNNEHKVPNAYQDITWIGYDDEESLVGKMSWLLKGEYGGVMIWSLDLDDFNGGSCNAHGGQRYPLINAMINALNNNSGSTTLPSTATPSTTTPSSESTTDLSCVIYPTSCSSAPAADGKYPDPISCNGYYHCVAGSYSYSSCASGMIYDPTSEICNFPSSVPKEHICCHCPEYIVGHPNEPC